MAEATYSTQQPTQNDWDRFLGCPGNDSDRALHLSSQKDFSELEASDFDSGLYTKKSATTTQYTQAFGLPQAQSLNTLRHVILQTVDVDTIFSCLINFVRASQGFQNDTVDISSKSIVGYVFDQTRFGEYKLQLFEHQGAVGLSCCLIDGFAPTVQAFWQELVQALENEGYITPDPMEASEDDDFFFSDDEEMEDLDLTSASFLSLDENPEVIGSYVEDLKDPNFMLHTLMLLSWNLTNQKNFEAARKACAQELFSNVVACLVSTATELTLPLVRSASILAAKLISEADVQVTKEQEAAIVQTIFSWTLNHGSSVNKMTVTRSEEIATVLTEQLGNFVRLSEKSRDVLETVHKETDFEQVRYNIGSVLHSIAVN